ncbi:MAG: transporter, partial [Candidatus Hydrogenedentes bacterium]|nr:transporter [Candidatus Hydrogenedentota bacterium]
DIYRLPIYVLVASIAGTAWAIDPTGLQTAAGMEGKVFELQQKLTLEKIEDVEWTSETSIEYEFSDRWALRLKIPVEFASEDDKEIDDGFGDLELRLKHVFNPDSSGIIIAGTAGVTFPTGEDSEGVGGDLRLRLSKWDLGKSKKHGLHATLMAKYKSDTESGEDHLFREDEPGEREFRWEAVLGYTYQVGESTRLILDVVREQAEHDDENENFIEAGLTHNFTDAITVAVGAGAGIGEESPDFVARAGVQFRF